MSNTNQTPIAVVTRTLPSSAVAEPQAPASNGKGTTPLPVTEQSKSKKKCIVLSLIRHGQCLSNIPVPVASDEEDILTNRGISQAECLGTEWKDVHIDVLQSSHLQRAYHTALQIAKHNHDVTLEVTTDDAYEEKRLGQAVVDASCAGRDTEAQALLTGLKPGEKGPLPRDYHPPGGESFNDVARRARISLIALLLKYGKELEEPPKEFLDKMVIDVDSPNILPEGIPHVVVVSHKVFMIELYESMFRWNGPQHTTTCEYDNAEWSRHIILYDQNTGDLEYSDMRVPCEIELWFPRSDF